LGKSKRSGTQLGPGSSSSADEATSVAASPVTAAASAFAMQSSFGNAAVIQMLGGQGGLDGQAGAIASAGVAGAGGALPHGEAVQSSFGRHDVGSIQAHVGGAAAKASASLGAEAFATGDHVAFSSRPDLHTAAHEAAHVVQQRSGVQLLGGVGRAGDRYERHADAVADKVVSGQSAEGLLNAFAGSGGTGVQLEESDPPRETDQQTSESGEAKVGGVERFLASLLPRAQAAAEKARGGDAWGASIRLISVTSALKRNRDAIRGLDQKEISSEELARLRDAFKPVKDAISETYQLISRAEFEDRESRKLARERAKEALKWSGRVARAFGDNVTEVERRDELAADRAAAEEALAETQRLLGVLEATTPPALDDNLRALASRLQALGATDIRRVMPLPVDRAALLSRLRALVSRMQSGGHAEDPELQPRDPKLVTATIRGVRAVEGKLGG